MGSKCYLPPARFEGEKYLSPQVRESAKEIASIIKSTKYFHFPLVKLQIKKLGLTFINFNGKSQTMRKEEKEGEVHAGLSKNHLIFSLL